MTDLERIAVAIEKDGKRDRVLTLIVLGLGVVGLFFVGAAVWDLSKTMSNDMSRMSKDVKVMSTHVGVMTESVVRMDNSFVDMTGEVKDMNKMNPAKLFSGFRPF